MSSLNQVQIIGNLGADPETRYTGSGTAITTIRVATTEKWKDKDGNPQEKTEWHRIKMWGKLAEIAGEYLAKGKQVFIQGRLETSQYTDKDGVERWSTDIVADTMKMLGSAGGQGGGNGGGQQRQGNGGGRPRENQMPGPGGSRPPQNEGFDDDDIPF
ncbi:single-stranded DNA-binding protein [Bradyrhizobium sp. 613_E4_N2_2]|uniref:single-stranded DNA-binding protein n=1 Tax=Bradyrhizobium sp. 613_E4_N2_2 TaxID=3240371 RepID=UPI003F88CA57